MSTAIPAEAFDHGDPRRYRRGCPCRPCTTGAANEANVNSYLRATGRGILRDPSRAAAHLRALRAAGLTDADIQRAARICTDVMYRILRGAGTIHRATEGRILQVLLPTTPPTVTSNHALTDGAGTRRRLQALVAAGWPGAALAARSGQHRQWVGELLHSKDKRVTLRGRDAVAVLYRSLLDQAPEEHGVPAHAARRARELALQHGWHPAAVWDDIDDPEDVPRYGARVSRVEAVVEDATELIGQGYSREAIAKRLGLTWDAVRQAYIRKGVPLPELAA